MEAPETSKLGIYVSIPFCRSKCTYCNFASGVYPASDHTRYVERLVEDMEAAPAWAMRLGVDLPAGVDSVYLGGGTPSLLEPHLIELLFGAMRRQFQIEPDAEITVECAPGQLADSTLAALAEAGVNRVSLGVQSFIDREAHVSGRLHSRATVLHDLKRLRAAGIRNLNIDLIAGLAGQTFASWDESLSVLLETGVPHASVYMLEVDEDSRLGREMLAGGARYHADLIPSDDAIARMYETAVERLASAGLHQYEISNFARRGRASKHNLRYWQRQPYLGLGLDASSALYSTTNGSSESPHQEPSFLLRSKTTDDLKVYLAASEAAETTWLSPERQHEEAWFLGLRLNAGVRPSQLRREFGRISVTRALDVADRLVKAGLIEVNGKTVRLSARGRLLSNDVFQEFLAESA
ncbi:MAG: radical SAM family heme chaperone HemW [Terracidiphilus sp.]